MVERARLLGAAFRVGHLISAAQPGVLPATHFRTRNHKLTLVLDDRIADLAADRVTNRFKQLTRLIGQGRAAKKR
jgi:exopolyphosphatase/guanosine-5'-triphosphate,3'-diphosphate pyrophosphatase